MPNKMNKPHPCAGCPAFNKALLCAATKDQYCRHVKAKNEHRINKSK